jgi:hypothetical protein
LSRLLPSLVAPVLVWPLIVCPLLAWNMEMLLKLPHDQLSRWHPARLFIWTIGHVWPYSMVRRLGTSVRAYHRQVDAEVAAQRVRQARAASYVSNCICGGVHGPCPPLPAVFSPVTAQWWMETGAARRARWIERYGESGHGLIPRRPLRSRRASRREMIMSWHDTARPPTTGSGSSTCPPGAR